MNYAHKWIKITALGFSLALGAGITYYLSTPTGPIAAYDAARDTDDIIKLFQQDWYLLSNRDWNEERQRWMMQTGSPNEYEPRYFGKMKINVMRDEKGTLVGFVTYYMKNFREGIVLFLAVNPQMRGKHYGEQLLNAAIQALRQQGAKVVSLLVRQENARALKLYTRAGLHETHREDDGFVHMEKVLN